MHLFAKLSLAAFFLAGCISAASAANVSINGTHGRSEIKSTCASSGGNYYSNLDGYGCIRENCDGNGGLCGVICKNDGKCEGSTPSIKGTKPPRSLKGILKPKTR